jgi:hypothetical protein
MPRGGRPQVLTTWKKMYAVRLVTVGGLDLAVEATREFQSSLRIGNPPQTQKPRSQGAWLLNPTNVRGVKRCPPWRPWAGPCGQVEAA